MTIIKKEGYPHMLESGPAPRNWMGADWAEVPEALEAEAWACLGYCHMTLGDLVIDRGTDEQGSPLTETVNDGVVTAIKAHQVPPAPEPQPTADGLIDILLGVSQ